MSNPSLISAIKGCNQSKYYTSINSTENTIENPTVNNNSNTCYTAIMNSYKNSLFIINNFYNDFCKNFCAMVLLFVISVFILYIIIIVVGLLCVGFNYIFEKSMVFLIGSALYNKNFPICTNTKYIGGDCYTTSSTYCN